MGLEDDFYATIKLKCGDEIFCKCAASDEGDRTMLLLSNPITIEEIKVRGQTTGYKFEPWLKSSSDDLFVINLDDVLTMSESENIDIIEYYEDYIRRSNKDVDCKLDRKMGHIGTVNETRKALENIFNKS